MSDAIEEARRAVAAAPDSADARMQLAQALIARFETHPAEAPMLAGEMLGALKKAHALDPKRPDAYHGLIGYYLNAPPIAGGSVEEAKKLADKLAAINPEQGAVAHRTIESHQAAATGRDAG